METALSHGDILHCVDTGEYLILMGRKDREYPTNDPERYETSWDIVDLLNGNEFWEWEFVLEDEKVYERVA